MIVAVDEGDALEAPGRIVGAESNDLEELGGGLVPGVVKLECLGVDLRPEAALALALALPVDILVPELASPGPILLLLALP